MIETAVSVAIVGMVAIIAVRSLGVGLRGSVNNLTHTLNPSLLEVPQITVQPRPLELITSSLPFTSKPAITDSKPESPSGGVPRIR
jgi:hypothetical protein